MEGLSTSPIRRSLLVWLFTFSFVLFSSVLLMGQTLSNADCISHYKQGLAFYNQGVTELKKQESECFPKAASYFSQARPHLEFVDSICPGDTNTLIALSGIYFAINEMEKSNACKARCDSVRREKTLLRLKKGYDSCIHGNDSVCAMYYAAQMFALDSNCTNKALLARAKGNYVCCVHGNARHTTDYVCALSRGEFYLVYGQYDKAIAAFNEAITFYPDESYPKEMIKACEMEKARKK